MRVRAEGANCRFRSGTLKMAQDNVVRFASVAMKDITADASLPAKYGRMLDKFPLKDMFDGKRTAVKMHVGGHIGYSTIHPLFVRILIQKLREAGADPFITDGSFSRQAITARGYTQEVIGAQFVPAAGAQDRYFYTQEVNYRGLKDIDLCGNIVDADALVDLSHFKGHGHAVFGAAIKNLGMGAVTVKTRGALHQLADSELHWDRDACIECRQCVEGCPTGAARFDDDGNFSIFFHNCIYCHHCTIACPEHAIEFDDKNIYYFHCGLALATREVLKHFDPANVLFINALLDITSFCDCWGFTTPSIVPDVGILASRSIMPIEKASVDMVKADSFIEGSLPGHVTRDPERGEHLLQQIWGRDPYDQIRAGEEVGLGASDYELEEVD
jgi:hypothetical protein